MRTYADCYPCFLRQAIAAARYAESDEIQLHTIIKEVLAVLQAQSNGVSPPEIGAVVHRVIREVLGIEDPYQNEKRKSTEKALKIYPRLKAIMREHTDLETAVRISIAGNIIDLGISNAFDDLWETVQRVLYQPFAINDLDKFQEQLSYANRLFFIGDNAGETVFDRVLIESLHIPVTYVVKGGPVLNDATREDAMDAGLDQCSTIIRNGSDAPGTVLSLCSKEFRKRFESAGLIIAKGQGNYETLSDAGSHVFCMLQVKCPVISHDIGVPTGSIVIRQSTNTC